MHASVLSDSVTPWTIASQAPLSMGFSRQEYWIGLPCPPPRDFPDPGIQPASPVSPALQVDSLSQSYQRNPISNKDFQYLGYKKLLVNSKKEILVKYRL